MSASGRRTGFQIYIEAFSCPAETSKIKPCHWSDDLIARRLIGAIKAEKNEHIQAHAMLTAMVRGSGGIVNPRPSRMARFSFRCVPFRAVPPCRVPEEGGLNNAVGCPV